MSNRPRSYFKSYSSCSGVSLVEVILAVALFSMVAVLVFDGQWKIGDLLMHNARIISVTNAANSFMTTGVFGTIGADGSVASRQGPFQTTQSFFSWPFSRCGTLSVLESVWQTGWGTTATTSFSFLTPDLQLVEQYAVDCGGQTKKFSDSEFTLTRSIDLGGAGGVVSAVDVFRETAFVTLRLASGAADTEPDLAFVSLNSPFETTLLRIGRGVNKIDAIGEYVFAANNSTTTQLGVVQVSGLAGSLSGQLVATSTLPGVAGVRPEAVSIFYADSKIYIGTKRTAGHEFHIYDVTNPVTPRWLGSREMNHNINDIAVKNGYAFLATSGNVRDLIVLNVHDPANISVASMVDLPGNEDGRSVQISGNNIFLGRYKATQPGRNELCVLMYWFDESGAMLTRLVGSAATGGDVTAVVVASGQVFVSTSNALKEFQVFDFSTNGMLVPRANRNLPAVGNGIDIENNMAAVVSGNQLLLYEQQ